MSPSNPNPSLAVIIGTSKEGSHKPIRFAKAGVRTRISSRDSMKARNIANFLNIPRINHKQL